MKRLRDFSIQDKLTLVIMIASTVALLVACGAAMAYSYVQFRRAIRQDVMALAASIQTPATATAVVFDDLRTAQEALQGLNHAPDVTAAAIYRGHGLLFVSYQSDNESDTIPREAPMWHGTSFSGQKLHFHEPIYFEDDVVGSLWMEADLRRHHSRLRDYAIGLVLVWCVAGMVALLLSRELQHFVTDSILELARVARAVTERNDYSLRANKHSDDESGLLTDAFNRMLRKIQENSVALRHANEQLHAEVAERRAAEEAVKQSYRFVAGITDASPNILYLIDLQKKEPLYINRQVTAMLGYSHDQVKQAGCPILEKHTHPDDLKKIQSYHQQLAFSKQGQIIEREFRVRDASGNWRWLVSYDTVHKRDADNMPSHVLGTIVDFTARKQTEQALQESEQRFRQLAENIREVFWLTNPDKTEMIYISPAYETIWGRSCESLYRQPKTWLDAIHPDDRPSVLEKALRQNRAPYDVVYRIIQPGGDIRWIRDRAFPVHENHEVVRIAGIAEDITVEKLASDARRDAEEKWRSLVENSPDLIFIVDRNCVITYINRIDPGIISGKVVGSRVHDHVPAEMHSMIETEIGAVFHSAQPVTTEFTLPTPNGQIVTFECRLVPVKPHGTIEAILLICSDITKRIRLEREILDISDREQRRIGQDLHDDVCQRLTAIAFAGSVLQHRLAGHEALDAANLVNMTNDSIALLRSLARGLYPVELERQGLATALQELASGISLRSGVTCDFQFDPALELIDHVVTMHLFRIAQEAVANAMRHAHATSIRIELRRQRSQMALSVRDNGVGLPADLRSNNGMGLHIMAYRARVIGANFFIQRMAQGGTEVVCNYPLPHTKEGQLP